MQTPEGCVGEQEMKRRRQSERRTEMKTCEITKTEGAIESRPSIFGKRDGLHESNSDCEPGFPFSLLLILVSRCVDASFCLSPLKWIARMTYQTHKQGLTESSAERRPVVI